MDKCPGIPELYPSTQTTVVPGMLTELVVSDCDVPTPELSLITSEAVSPRLLSAIKAQKATIELTRPSYRNYVMREEKTAMIRTQNTYTLVVLCVMCIFLSLECNNYY